MKKRMIKKQMYDSVDLVDDDILNKDWREKAKNSKVLRFEYGGFVSYYPISKATYQKKTNAQLIAYFLPCFVRAYTSAKKEKEQERKGFN